MCIALLSTAHPAYKLILIDNRDEFLNRPTAPASWWPSPNSQVFGGRDLLRDIQGTWLGATKTGKIAVLTNYREDTTPDPRAVSRGAIIRKFLTEDVGLTGDFVRDVVSTGVAKDAGGFSLVCGNVGEKLAVISNRAASQAQVPWVAGDMVQTVGLSNAAFTDRSWEKVTLGEEMMLDAIRANTQDNDGEDRLIDRLLTVLSHDSLARQGDLADGGLETYLTELRKSILVPPIGRTRMGRLDEGSMRAAKSKEKFQIIDDPTNLQLQKLGIDGVYATQKQTVVLIDQKDRVRFFERTLFDSSSNCIPPGKGDIDEEFIIER